LVASTADVNLNEIAGSGVGRGRDQLASVVSRWNPRLVKALTVVGFGLPLVGYFWLLGRFSVNVLVGDDWDEVPVIKQSYVHYFDWRLLWTQRNENRIFFPNLIVVLIAHTLHYDIHVVEYLGAVMLVAATTFILVAHRRRSPSTQWLYYCPVAFLTFSFVQEGNTLWAFQMAWFMVLLALATALLLLDRATLTWLALGGAIAAATVGSLSSLQGLLIWPAGLVLCFYRRRVWTEIGVWIVAGIAATAVYLRNYHFSATPFPRFALQHPMIAVKFFFFLIGDVVGKPVAPGNSHTENTLVVLFGIFIVALAIGTVLICGFRRDERTGSPIGIALICFGLLFAVIVTQGRSYNGYGGASASRYTTFDLLIVAGIYLALLGRRPLWRGGVSDELDHSVFQRSTIRRSSAGHGSGKISGIAYRIAVVLVVGAMVVQIPLGFHYGLSAARSFHASQVTAAETLRNINHVSNPELAQAEFFVPPSVIRRQAPVLEEHRLSVFDQ
jgi:hypothetical protein